MSRLRLCTSIVLVLSSLSSFSQARQKRITVLPFKDRTNSGRSMNISEKVADAIMSKLAETGQFTVVDRESLAAIQSEKNLKFDADFNPLNAPKSGLLAVCDIVITGQIDEFNANQNSVETGNYISKKTEVRGTTALKISARIVAVETGQILGAPSARAEKDGVLAKSSSSTLIPNVGTNRGISNTTSALSGLVDSDIEEVAEAVAKKISASSVGVVATAPIVQPKFVGMEAGMVVISKGANAGVKIGDTFDVVRPTDSGMEDPDAPGTHIIRRKKLCTLVISSLEDTISEGKCEGATLQKGDEIRKVPKS